MKQNIRLIVKHAEVSEKEIEKYLCERVKAAGGVCLKYSNPGVTGYPDRVVLLPGGVTFWVELKSKGRKPTKLQQIRIESLRKMCHEVYVADSKEKIDELIGYYNK